MNLFYTPNITSTQYQLDPEESRHCIKVLRYNKGDTIKLTDGQGFFYDAEIVEDNPKKCILNILYSEKDENKHPFRLHLAVALTKNINRFEWFIEKATEIGIDEISPLICENSERKSVNNERLNKIIVSAMKQSLKAFFPKLNNIVSFEQLINNCIEKARFIAYIDDSETQSLEKLYKKKEDVIILIGPEGDFSKEEIKIALQNNFHPISLGKARLRTETAAIVACTQVHLLNE